MDANCRDTLILNAIQIARKNWNDWQDVFEHGFPIHTSPLLVDQKRFASFCKGYSVSRTIRRGTQNELRLALGGRDFLEALRDDTGREFDKLEKDLRVRFGTGNSRRIISVLSKVAAFVRPERFVAWDRYAKRGANIVQRRGVSFQFNAYADYLADFDIIWSGPTGQQIRDYVAGHGAQKRGLETEPRFLRRVLDVCLMICGGRTFQ